MQNTLAASCRITSFDVNQLTPIVHPRRAIQTEKVIRVLARMCRSAEQIWKTVCLSGGLMHVNAGKGDSSRSWHDDMCQDSAFVWAYIDNNGFGGVLWRISYAAGVCCPSELCFMLSTLCMRNTVRFTKNIEQLLRKPDHALIKWPVAISATSQHIT